MRGLLSTQNEGADMFECEICGRDDFKSKQGLAGHKRLKHPIDMSTGPAGTSTALSTETSITEPFDQIRLEIEDAKAWFSQEGSKIGMQVAAAIYPYLEPVFKDMHQSLKSLQHRIDALEERLDDLEHHRDEMDEMMEFQIMPLLRRHGMGELIKVIIDTRPK